MLNLRVARPALVVDVNGVPGLDRVRAGEDGTLHVGALVRHSRLLQDSTVATAAPLLAKAAPLIGHHAVRNRGTLGGSLCHADPAAELLAAALALDARLRLIS